MLKKILLATSFLVAAPAFAQDKPAADTTQAQPQSATPDQADAVTSDPAATAQATPQSTPAPAAETAQPTPSQPAEQASQPAATQDQVAQAVNRDFGTYDKDANGTLSQAEFASWIGTLRKAAEPGFQPGTPDAEAYVGQAFAATDVDKNKSVDKAELTTFLTPKPA